MTIPCRILRTLPSYVRSYSVYFKLKTDDKTAKSQTSLCRLFLSHCVYLNDGKIIITDVALNVYFYLRDSSAYFFLAKNHE